MYDDYSDPIYSVYTLAEGIAVDYDTSDLDARYSPAPDPSDMLPLFDLACADAQRESAEYGAEISAHLYEPLNGIMHASATYSHGERVA